MSKEGEKLRKINLSIISCRKCAFFLMISIAVLLIACGEKETYEEKEETTVDEIVEEPADEDFVEASFEPKSYPKAADDGKPDYSGVYVFDVGRCELIKQEDGSYYCDAYIYRDKGVRDEKAIYKSEGMLETRSDDYYKGIIEIKDDKADVTIIGKEGEKGVLSDGFKFDYPDMDDYTGIYRYSKKDGTEVVVTVGYGENREPKITLQDGEDTYEFSHHPNEERCCDSGIFVTEIGDEGEILLAEDDDRIVGPDDELLQMIRQYRGDKYLVIKRQGDKAFIFYKILKPVSMK